MWGLFCFHATNAVCLSGWKQQICHFPTKVVLQKDVLLLSHLSFWCNFEACVQVSIKRKISANSASVHHCLMNWQLHNLFKACVANQMIYTFDKKERQIKYLLIFRSWSQARWQSRIIANAWFAVMELCPVSDVRELLCLSADSLVVTFWTKAGWKYILKNICKLVVVTV